MARRKAAVQQAGAAQDPHDATPAGQPAKDGPHQPQCSGQQQPQPQPSGDGACDGPLYYPRQYGGLVLGTLACTGTVSCYDQADPWMVWKLVGWLLLALVALLCHELRPFKRMNYGDQQRELQEAAVAEAGKRRD